MIHRYRNNGLNIVLDVNSGAVHVVDDLVYDLIPLMEDDPDISDEELTDRAGPEHKKADIIEAAGEIRTLYENGTLFSKDVFEPYIERFTAGKKENPVIKALCLHIAHDCNLRCSYCFAGDGEYHGRKALMSYEVGKKALDLLIRSSGSRVNLEVDFFGGEPTLNFDVVKKLVEYGRSREKECNK
ncbi:MAG: 4Fe-4S cluster-binding domain-containing protein, partial [Lachnospiraceae bacterium]|nr:4Fe-4S cluster-binding domain-containing protein [Lachnospiraceae bacterium]